MHYSFKQKNKLRVVKVFYPTCFLFLLSCVLIPPVGESYKKPEIKSPKSWLNFFNQEEKENKNDEPTEFEKSELSWWHKFGDDTLNYLVEEALENNYDYRLAQSRVVEARSNITAKTANLLPQASAKASGTRFNSFFNPVNPSQHPIINFFTAGFDASWELDLFGGNYRARQAAKALHEASNEAKNYILVSLIAEVVRNYTELRKFQNQLEAQKMISAFYDEIIALAQEKRDVGLLSEIDFNRLNIEALNNQSDLTIIRSQADTALYNLEFLLGKNPGEMKEMLERKIEIPIFNRNLLVKAPASLLRDRPDIKQAERELAAAHANIGYALAQVFPKISLTGFFGYNNTKSGNLIAPQSRVFSSGVQVSQSFNALGVIAGYKIAKAKKSQALINYEATVNKALLDVESSLSSYSNELTRFDLSSRSFVSSQIINNLNRAKFDQGLISYSDFLKSQIEYLKSKQEFDQRKSDFVFKTVAVYKALGGGWQVLDKKTLDKKNKDIKKSKK